MPVALSCWPVRPKVLGATLAGQVLQSGILSSMDVEYSLHIAAVYTLYTAYYTLGKLLRDIFYREGPRSRQLLFFLHPDHPRDITTRYHVVDER